MTKAGKLEKEFEIWKKDIEARVAALEAAKAPNRPTPAKPSKPTKVEEKASEIVIEATDDIIAKDVE